MKKIVLLAFVLVLLSLPVVIEFIRPVEASGTIYIRADGSVEGTTHISTVDNVTYTFTDNINDSIVVERDNIVVDGAGYTLQGTGSGTGIYLSYRSNVTIKNMEIKAFYRGIWLEGSSNTIISGNNIVSNTWQSISLRYSSNNHISRNNITANNDFGIYFEESSSNTISGNKITNNEWNGILVAAYSNNNYLSGNNIANNYYGISVDGSNNTISGNNITDNTIFGIELESYSSDNTISGNKITHNGDGIWFSESSNNTISGNNITDNRYGIWFSESSNNKFYHNNFIDNVQHVHIETSGYANFWDDGYPSGGSYWSDFEERYPDVEDVYSGSDQDEPGSDGFWDEPYVIDEGNQDNYPIVPEFPTWTSMLLILTALAVTIVIYKRRLSKTPIH